MNKRNIIFLGNNEKTLETLLQCDIDILAAVYELDHDLKHYGAFDEKVKSQGGRVVGIQKDNKEALLSALKEFERPDLFVINVFSILSKEALAIPKTGCINIHPSLLPDYKGPHPIQWALINGERETGITFMDLDPGVDTGNIYRKVAFEIHAEDDTLTIAEKMDGVVVEHLSDVIKGVLRGELVAVPQEGPGSYFPKINALMRFVNFRKMTANDVNNLARSQVKYGGVITTVEGNKIDFYRSKVVNDKSTALLGGEVVGVNVNGGDEYSVTVQCISDKLELFTRNKAIKSIKNKDMLGT